MITLVALNSMFRVRCSLFDIAITFLLSSPTPLDMPKRALIISRNAWRKNILTRAAPSTRSRQSNHHYSN